jgi:pyruvate,water dikinase
VVITRIIHPAGKCQEMKRGGMLIHGAIIAREYGLPWIAGASQAMQLIKNGEQITVDGYLGIITCKTDNL